MLNLFIENVLKIYFSSTFKQNKGNNNKINNEKA